MAAAGADTQSWWQLVGTGHLDSLLGPELLMREPRSCHHAECLALGRSPQKGKPPAALGTGRACNSNCSSGALRKTPDFTDMKPGCGCRARKQRRLGTQPSVSFPCLVSIIPHPSSFLLSLIKAPLLADPPSSLRSLPKLSRLNYTPRSLASSLLPTNALKVSILQAASAGSPMPSVSLSLHSQASKEEPVAFTYSFYVFLFF